VRVVVAGHADDEVDIWEGFFGLLELAHVAVTVSLLSHYSQTRFGAYVRMTYPR
jgi:hypothetical protein